VLTLTFTPALPILSSDVIVISGSQTTPSIDGSPTITSVVASNKITVDFGKDISDMTPGGSIKVTTSAAAQASDMVTSAATDVGDAAGGAAGGALGGLGGGLLEGTGLDKYASQIKMACIGLAILILIGVLYKLYTMFKR
jgi:predicted lipid-binding transport protein (Tim44 family)